jgi:hypothetical protein
MTEIEKLKFRLSHVRRGVTEYRMTVNEAQGLVKEIDALIAKQEKPHVEVVLNEPAITTRIIDGGVF